MFRQWRRVVASRLLFLLLILFINTSMAFKWTAENCINLIENYKQYPCLWESTDMKYKCREAKNDAWSAICSSVGCAKEDAKRKMRNLVAQFYRERKKYRQLKKSGAGAYFVSKWFAYNSLLFLRDKNKVRPCKEGGLTGNTELHSSNSSKDDDQEKDDNETQDITQSLSEDNQLSTQQEDMQPEIYQDDTRSNSNNIDKIDDSVQLQNEIQTSTVNKKPEGNPQTIEKPDEKFKRPKKRRATQNVNQERQEEAYMFLKDLQQKHLLKDSCSVFGEHVACKMRRLKTEHAQNTVEHLIGNILWEASTGKYDEPYSSHGSPYLYMSTISPSTSSVTPSPLPSPLQSNIQEPENDGDIIYTALSSLM